MPVTYEVQDRVAVVTHDDGKANVYTLDVLAELSEALEKSAADEGVSALLLAGRDGRFSAGFDLATMTSSEDSMRALVAAGGRFVARLVLHPMPVVVACTGHALAAGALVLLAGDRRIGAAGEYKIGLNEVAIGMPLPVWAVELARYRMPAGEFDRIVLGEIGGPEAAVRSGFLDDVAPAGVIDVAMEEAQRLSALRRGAVSGTKTRARRAVVERMLDKMDEDLASVGKPSAQR
ncbi:MAG TPA: crotonase/enoyl-CoA hydratase family protein [Acidimicrobiales bacterium]|nr:crotonase/enoyl-CoA hydratase family protein [Acidimicrobiales bacterium]